MWRLVVSVAPPHHSEFERLSSVISNCLKTYLVHTVPKFTEELQVPNDPYMRWELEQSEEESKLPEDLITMAASAPQPFSDCFIQAASIAMADALKRGRISFPGNETEWPDPVISIVAQTPLSEAELRARYRLTPKTEKKVAVGVKRFVDFVNTKSGATRRRIRPDLSKRMGSRGSVKQAARPTDDEILEELSILWGKYEGE